MESDDEAQVTATKYDPDDDLRELLEEVLHDATVSYGDEQDLDLSADIEGFQRDYDVTFGEFEASGFETYAPFGVFVSLKGHLGLAASVSSRRRCSPAYRPRPTLTKRRRHRSLTTRIRI